jgi:hypothetical protein
VDLEQLKQMAPDLVVLDLRQAESMYALPVLCALPGVTLLGLDAVTGTLNVLTGQTHPLHSLGKVLKYVQEVARPND